MQKDSTTPDVVAPTTKQSKALGPRLLQPRITKNPLKPAHSLIGSVSSYHGSYPGDPYSYLPYEMTRHPLDKEDIKDDTQFALTSPLVRRHTELSSARVGFQPGMLYIRIIEARHPALQSSSDYNVSIIHHTATNKTEDYPDSKTPTWNSEFIVEFRTPQHLHDPIIFQLKKHRAIVSDKQIEQYILMIEQLPTTLTEQWLKPGDPTPLLSSSTANGEIPTNGLRVVICFTSSQEYMMTHFKPTMPSPTTESHNALSSSSSSASQSSSYSQLTPNAKKDNKRIWKMPRMRIIIFNPYCNQGETMHVMVVYASGPPGSAISSLVMTLYGGVQTSWSEGSGEDRRNYGTKEIWFNQDTVLWDGEKQKMKYVESGVHRWYIGLKFPDQPLPASILATAGGIHYFLMGTIKFASSFQLNTRSIAHISLRPLPGPLGVEPEVHQGTQGSGLLNKGHATLKVWIDNVEPFVPKTYPVHIQITNHKTKPINKAIKMKFMMTVICYDRSHSTSSSFVYWTTTLEHAPILPSQMIELNTTMTMPPAVEGPSVSKDLAHFMQLKYQFIVSIGEGGVFKQVPTCVIPITITPSYPVHAKLKQYMSPLPLPMPDIQPPPSSSITPS